MSLNGNIEKYYSLMAVSSVGLIIENILAIFFFTRYSKSEQEKNELELLSKVSDTEAKRYLEIEKLYDNIRFMRHDIKEQLLYASQLVENGEIEKANDHIKRMESNVEKTYDMIHTGNRVIDNIIYSNISLHKDIQFIVTGMLNDLSFIDDVKLVSLFGNMIDNAVECVLSQEDKVIELTFSFTSGYQNIACKNPISSSVIKSNPMLKTTKKEASAHGYGIKSMKNIVESIDGMIEFYEKNNYFICHIAIPLKEESKS
jgi:sensor histidine kinase regulating citrate/malate metabolism